MTCRVSQRSKHTYVCVRLDNQWLRCDPSDDRALSTASHHLNPQCTPVTWTGAGDALPNLDPAHILDDEYSLADIDAVMAKPMRLAMRVPVRIGNHFVEFLRDRASSIDATAEVDAFRALAQCAVSGESPVVPAASRAEPVAALG